MKLRVLVSAFVLVELAGASGCRHPVENTKADPLLTAYDTEADWSDAQHIIPLSYQQAQGKRIFYEQCVWCHADATPAGPSNRSSLTPVPPLLNDGAVLNAESNETLQNIVTLGGAAVGKSAMMPPYGRMLSAEDIRDVIAFARAIAQPPYQPSARAGSQDSAGK
jgi:cytochrome c oxidase cbb3-type subunit 3